MSNTVQHRLWQLEQFEWALRVYAHVLADVSEAESATLRDGGDGWTVREVMGHLLDYERLFHERAKLTTTQDTPVLPAPPSPDELAIANGYNQRTLASLAEDWHIERVQYLKTLATFGEDMWERAAQHPTRGHFTLLDQVMLTARHDMLHLDQIAKILEERSK